MKTFEERKFNHYFEIGDKVLVSYDLPKYILNSLNNRCKDISKVCVVRKCFSDLHAFGQGSIYHCEVDFGGDDGVSTIPAQYLMKFDENLNNTMFNDINIDTLNSKGLLKDIDEGNKPLIVYFFRKIYNYYLFDNHSNHDEKYVFTLTSLNMLFLKIQKFCPKKTCEIDIEDFIKKLLLLFSVMPILLIQLKNVDIEANLLILFVDEYYIVNFQEYE